MILRDARRKTDPYKAVLKKFPSRWLHVQCENAMQNFNVFKQ